MTARWCSRLPACRPFPPPPPPPQGTSATPRCSRPGHELRPQVARPLAGLLGTWLAPCAAVLWARAHCRHCCRLGPDPPLQPVPWRACCSPSRAPRTSPFGGTPVPLPRRWACATCAPPASRAAPAVCLTASSCPMAHPAPQPRRDRPAAPRRAGAPGASRSDRGTPARDCEGLSLASLGHHCGPDSLTPRAHAFRPTCEPRAAAPGNGAGPSPRPKPCHCAARAACPRSHRGDGRSQSDGRLREGGNVLACPSSSPCASPTRPLPPQPRTAGRGLLHLGASVPPTVVGTAGAAEGEGQEAKPAPALWTRLSFGCNTWPAGFPRLPK